MEYISNIYDNLFNDTTSIGGSAPTSLGSGQGNFSRNNFGFGSNQSGPQFADPTKQTDEPGRTFSQDFYGTDSQNLFGRNLMHNAANDIAGNKPFQSQEVYQQNINAQPASLGANNTPGVTPGVTPNVTPSVIPGVTSNSTQSKNIQRMGSSFSDNRIKEI